MTSIEELREKIFAVPQTFASGAGSGEVANFDLEGGETGAVTSFQNGFPQRFAKDPTTASGAYILRTDMNKFGELATSELHFKEAGGKHKFESALLEGVYGYPLMCLFGHYDEHYLKSIESQVKENQMNFTENPLCIDNLAAIGTSGEKKVYWRTANKIYGLDEDLFRIEVDYSRVDKLQSGTELAEDSLIVIGDYGYPEYVGGTGSTGWTGDTGWTGWTGETGSTGETNQVRSVASEMSSWSLNEIGWGDLDYSERDAASSGQTSTGPTYASLTLFARGATGFTGGETGLEFPNKGKCGIKTEKAFVDERWSKEVIPCEKEEETLTPVKVIYPSQMCGYGNSTLVFYAKAGTSVSYKFSDGQTQKSGTNVFAFPVKLGVGKATDND